MLNVMLSMASFERERVAEDIGETAQERRAEGNYMGTTPLGYRKVKIDGVVQLEPEPETHELVTECFRKAAQGASFIQLVRYLAENNVERETSAVSRMMKSPVYLGMQPGVPEVVRGANGRKEKRRTWIPGPHKELVTQPEFDAVQGARRTGKKLSHESQGILAGLIACAGCGRKLSVAGGGKTDRSKTAYCCPSAAVKAKCSDPEEGQDKLGPAYGQVRLVDAYIRAAINQARDDGTLRTTMSVVEQRRAAEKKVSQKKQRLAYTRRPETRQRFEDEPEVWEAQVDEDKRQLDEALAVLREVAKEGHELAPDPGWECRMDLDEQRRLAKQLIEEATLRSRKGGEGRGRNSTPIHHRIRIRWAGHAEFDATIAKRVEENSQLDLGLALGSRLYKDWQMLLSLGGDVTIEQFAEAAGITKSNAGDRLRYLVHYKPPKASAKGEPYQPKTFTALP
jgi:recombinase